MATLLVVDDSAMDRRLVGGILDKNPEWTVIYAVNGKEALAEIESHNGYEPRTNAIVWERTDSDTCIWRA